MKKISSFLLVISFSTVALSQNFTDPITIETNDDAVLSFNNTDDSWQYFQFKRSGVRKTWMGLSNVNNFQINKEGSGNIILTGGNVGIGTVSPATKLDVEGGDFYLGEEVSGNGQRRQFRVYGYDNGSQFYGSIHSNWEDSKRTFDIYTSSSTNQLKIDASANSSARIAILPGENAGVGIGTLTTGSHKLAVEGSIGAREIKVEASGWSDFVFYDNYKLPTLQEVENHIKKKRHLKDIPSADDVKENGINLGEMNAKLLQKVEELTLYIIEQNKQLEKANQNISELQKKVSILEND